MEPSSVEDGNFEGLAAELWRTMLQWSRPQLRTETGDAADAVQGGERCFNGAVLS